MSAARVIWVIWCLVWVLIWAGFGLHDAAAWGACHNTDIRLGLPVLSCGSPAWPLAGFALAAASGAAILLPVGKRPR